MSGVPQGAVIALIAAAVLLIGVPLFLKLIGFRIIGNAEVGIVEKLWSRKGSLHNRIIALNGEAGFQPDVLRGGFHMVPGYQYRVHKVSLVTIHRGRIGYVFARDGQPLGRYSEGDSTISNSGQTLARVAAMGDFTDVRKFLADNGQQGPQRAILREGTYAINLSQFTVISGVDQIHFLPLGNKDELNVVTSLAKKIEEEGGFKPVIIDGSNDLIGTVTVSRRSLAAARRYHRAYRRRQPGRSPLSQQLPGPGSVPACRRLPRPPVSGPYRGNLLHQWPLRECRTDTEDDHRARRGRCGRVLPWGAWQRRVR
jgi:hypothetical protein